MINPNLADKLQQLTLKAVAEVTSDTNGTGVDLLDYEGPIKILLDSGAGTGNADNTLDCKIQDSADNSSFADVSGATFTQVDDTAGGSRQAMSLNTNSLKRYIRLVMDVEGTTPSFLVSCQAVAMKKYG